MSKSRELKNNIKKVNKDKTLHVKNEKDFLVLNLPNWILILAVIAVGVILYSNTFKVPFYYDDYDSIVGDPLIKNLDNFFRFPSFYDFIHARYLSSLTFALNFHFDGINVTGYHIVNIAIHLVNSLLVMMLTSLTLNTSKLREIFSNKDKTAFILIVGLIFISHPVQTQAVTYVIQRMTSLATMCYLASLCIYIKARSIYLSSPVKSTKKYLKVTILFIFSIISAFMGMGSKQIVLTIPATIIIYEILFFRNKEKRINWKVVLPLISIFIIFVIIAILIFGLPSETDEISRKDYLLTQINVLVTYLRLFLIPINQNLDYDFPIYQSLLDVKTIGCLLLLTSLIAVSIKFWKKYPLISFSILWFFITLSIESSIIPIRDVIVEHRLYLPLFGLSLLIASLVFMIPRRYNVLKFSILAVFILSCSVLTYLRNELWNDPIAMWTDSMNKSPNKVRPEFFRGYVYLQKNEVDMAILDFKNVIAKDKNYYRAYDNLGIAYQEKKDFQTAIQYMNEAIRIKPESPYAYNNRASAYIYIKDYEKALVDLNKAIELQGNYTDAFYNLGYVHYFMHNYEEAIKKFSIALVFNPTYTQAHYYLASSFYNIGKYKEAWDQINIIKTKGLEPDMKLVNKLKNKSPQ
ncbi:MAG: tetratricopeptide repeat protein [Ignavibacteriales bacterium]|nr:tetratricopeptide repeat protein [Ignavibacteriales bacterium]